MIIQPPLASSVGARIIAAALVVFAAIAPATARDPAAAESKVRAEDRTAVTSCLDLVAQAAKRQADAANKAEAESDGGSKADKIDPADWLRHAGERAAIDEASCIGVVSTPCQQTTEGRTDAGSVACIDREAAVWDERLNKSYKKWIETCGEAKVCAARRKFARAWLAARDARCALPVLEMQGTMANPLTASCLLDTTAHHALWLGGDTQ
jgi:uncharacterized protein YecT (DUF1311 family)